MTVSRIPWEAQCVIQRWDGTTCPFWISGEVPEALVDDDLAWARGAEQFLEREWPEGRRIEVNVTMLGGEWPKRSMVYVAERFSKPAQNGYDTKPTCAEPERTQ